MKRIGLLTAGGDTPALNATVYGAVERANALDIEVLGITNGFQGMLDDRVPHVRLNPLFMTIPELDPCRGGTILGASRTYIDPQRTGELQQVTRRLDDLGIEGLLCIGGDGTINGMQPLCEFLPCVLAPKTIDNDLGLNYLDEANEWLRTAGSTAEDEGYQLNWGRDEIDLEEIVNYATPGYATSVFVVAQGVQRIRTTAESHRRIGIVEVMGRQSGYIALGSAYGQPDIILVPEIPLDLARLEDRIRELYDLQEHVVIVVGEGVLDENGQPLGEKPSRYDPAGRPVFSGAAETLKQRLIEDLGDEFFRSRYGNETAESAIFTRRVGHTQRGGRPIKFDRFYAIQLGGHAVDLLYQGHNNSIATLGWSAQEGLTLNWLSANKLRDRWGVIHPRLVHKSLYDVRRFGPSKLGVEYLRTIFTDAIGADDVEILRSNLFRPGNLSGRYQSVNVDLRKRLHYLQPE